MVSAVITPIFTLLPSPVKVAAVIPPVTETEAAVTAPLAASDVPVFVSWIDCVEVAPFVVTT